MSALARSPLLSVDCPNLDASEWSPLLSALLAAGTPALAVARLSGAEVSLGRWQRAASVLVPELQQRATLQRRLSGGRVAGLGEGLFGVALVLPGLEWLEPGLPLGRVLNRGVRGILQALRRLGAPASYGGREFIGVEGGQGGLLGFERSDTGQILIECLLAAETHWWPPAEWERQPRRPHPRLPGPRSIEALQGRSSADLLSALSASYPLRPSPSPAPRQKATPPATEEHDEALFSWITPRPCSAGFFEIGVESAGEAIGRVRLRGDLLADGVSLSAFEHALQGQVPSAEALAPCLNAFFTQPRHALLGVDPSDLLPAILEAARRGP